MSQMINLCYFVCKTDKRFVRMIEGYATIKVNVIGFMPQNLLQGSISRGRAFYASTDYKYFLKMAYGEEYLVFTKYETLYSS